MSINQKVESYPLPELPQIPERTFTITDYGAEAGGLSICTSMIQATLDACAAAGGGTVIIPSGIWRTGPLTLYSRINLYAERGALVQFVADSALYPLVPSYYEGISGWRCQAPLDGEGLNDIAITGEGIFDGSGEGWRPVKRFKMTELQWNKLIGSGGVLDKERETWWPSRAAMDGEAYVRRLQESEETTMEAYLSARDYLRPVLLSLRNCRRVLLEGPTFQNSPAWCVHPMGCEHITVRNIRVRNPWYSQNGDGIDLESCSYALVEHCNIDVGDDAICLKSGKDEEGRRLAKPCRYITIRHCTVYHGHGGVVIGSEMSGGVHAVRVYDCLFIGTDIGLRFKSARGRGGVVEDIVMENIAMSGIIHEAVSFHMFYAGVEGSDGHDEQLLPVTEETPRFRDITLRNVVCQGANTALLVNGLPELPLSGLTIENLQIVSERGIILRNADSLKLDNIRLQSDELPALQIQRCSNVSITNSDQLLPARS